MKTDSKKDTPVNSSVLTRHRANEVLAEAAALMVDYPQLRLGQALVNCLTPDECPKPFPELFYEECPVKASELFYSLTENQGRRVMEGGFGELLLGKLKYECD